MTKPRNSTSAGPTKSAISTRLRTELERERGRGAGAGPAETAGPAGFRTEVMATALPLRPPSS